MRERAHPWSSLPGASAAQVQPRPAAGQPPSIRTPPPVQQPGQTRVYSFFQPWSLLKICGDPAETGEFYFVALAFLEPSCSPLPLDVCVASTQGEIGFLLQQALDEALAIRGLSRPVATVLAQVAVARDDPAFARPTKPIGPFYSREEADARRLAGWTLVEEPSRGFRRAVPSPEPVDIIEEPAIRALVDAGVIVITLGGGGIPVVRDGPRLLGAEAVVDKDLASALLAIRLRVDVFLICTDVDRIYLDFATPQARGLGDVTAVELGRYAAAGHFPPGTMGPKVDAVLRFVAAGGRDAIVTSPECLATALHGQAGTRVRGHVSAGVERSVQ
ncbi:MAG: carbamate kinase [Acidobacteria bacterium]|nr:carbamate kinase [Acidobacteriota bacterium]